MKAALIAGGVGIALIVLTPAWKLLLPRRSSKLSDQEYFAAARKRAIGHRLARTATRGGEAQIRGNK